MIKSAFPLTIRRRSTGAGATLVLVATLVSATLLTACTSDRLIQPTLHFNPPSSEFEGLQIGRMEQWSGELVPGGELEVINPYGDVYIRHNRGGPNVGLSGAIQRLGDPAAVEIIELKASREHIRLEVSYPPGTDPSPAGFDRPGRVDLAVLIPQDTSLRVRTRDGSITGKRVRSSITAETESGRIDLSTTGSIDARSISGNIQLVLIGDSWSQPHRAHTETGSIAIELPIDAVMSLRARSGGTLAAQPEALAEQLQRSEGQLTGNWGNPPQAHRLEAESAHGDISFSLYGWVRNSAVTAPVDGNGKPPEG